MHVQRSRHLGCILVHNMHNLHVHWKKYVSEVRKLLKYKGATARPQIVKTKSCRIFSVHNNFFLIEKDKIAVPQSQGVALCFDSRGARMVHIVVPIILPFRIYTNMIHICILLSLNFIYILDLVIIIMYWVITVWAHGRIKDGQVTVDNNKECPKKSI